MLVGIRDMDCIIKVSSVCRGVIMGTIHLKHPKVKCLGHGHSGHS